MDISSLSRLYSIFSRLLVRLTGISMHHSGMLHNCSRVGSVMLYTMVFLVLVPLLGGCDSVSIQSSSSSFLIFQLLHTRHCKLPRAHASSPAVSPIAVWSSACYCITSPYDSQLLPVPCACQPLCVCCSLVRVLKTHRQTNAYVN